VLEVVGDTGIERGLAAPVVGIDNLDDTPSVPRARSHLVCLTEPSVLYDVGTGLGKRQGNVGACIRHDSEGLQAAVEDLAAYRHADGITG
jgi:hypothetical protein